MSEPRELTSDQLSLIIQTIKSEISSDDFYAKLISLVEKMTAINTKMVDNQDELKRLVRDEVIPAFSSIKTIDSEYFKKTCEDVNALLHGADYKFLDLIKEVKESRIIKSVKKAIFGFGFLGSAIALLSGLYFIWTAFIAPSLKIGGQ